MIDIPANRTERPAGGRRSSSLVPICPASPVTERRRQAVTGRPREESPQSSGNVLARVPVVRSLRDRRCHDDAYRRPPRSVRSLIPARIDRLPWSPFHTRMVVALGIAWSSTASRSPSPATSARSSPTATAWASRRPRSACSPRSTCSVRWSARWSSATSPTGSDAATCSSSRWPSTSAAARSPRSPSAPEPALHRSSTLTRFIAGAGIGGEYAAINSAIDELIPARYRGHTDLAVNGTYWAGAAIAAAIQVPLLSGAICPASTGGSAFLFGPVLAS